MFAGKNLRVVSADINKAFVAYGSRKKRIATPVVSSAYDLGFRDETFDTIIVPDAFHHILDHDRLFSECARVLKPGGTLIIFDIVLDKQAPNAVINHFVDGCIWSLTVQGFTDRINVLAGTHRFAVTGLATSKEKTVMGLLGGVDIEARLVKQR